MFSGKHGGESSASAGPPSRRLFNVRDVDGTIKLYAALALLLEAGLATLVIRSPTREVQLMAGLGMIGVFGLMVIIAGLKWESTSDDSGTAGQFDGASEIGSGLDTRVMGDDGADNHDPLWGELSQGHVDAWVGTWRCQWTARDADGKLVPYVDDTVTVESVDRESGELTAFARGTYDRNFEGYDLGGRVSRKWLAHLYYHFPPPHDEKVGMVILRIDPQRDVAKGWWLGGGRGKEAPNVEGNVTWTQAKRWEGDWTNQVHAFE